MSDSFIVRSRLGDYQVVFTDCFVREISNRVGDCFCLVDRNVMSLLAEELKPVLPQSRTLELEASEQAKTLESCIEVIRWLVDAGVRRNHTLLAIGGGVIQDVCGFVATILYRGIPWNFVPTTLLAQADSCIGSKTSINLGEFKNLVGSFYPPQRVLIDPRLLSTLPESEVKSGIGEILHYYLVDGNERAGWLRDNYGGVLGDPQLLLQDLKLSLSIKKAMIERDELDQGERRLFNYGHTFGHAIEAVTRYTVNHGQAVTVGMDLANFISREIGYLDGDTFESMSEVLRCNMPDFELPRTRLEEYLTALRRDKKNRDGQLGCILTRGPGAMELTYLSFDGLLPELIAKYFASRPGS